MMTYLPRLIEEPLKHSLDRGKSVLLLGARQTGKTTVIEECIKPDIYYNLIQPPVRRLFEQKPEQLAQEIRAEVQIKYPERKPIVFIDEVQKVPLLLDVIQDLIDHNVAQFILTGSSARKFRQSSDLNLLPGRVVRLIMTPLMINELEVPLPSIEKLLLYGSLPDIYLQTDAADSALDLESYVDIYLEEEVRKEALARSLSDFHRFLSLAAIESGNELNLSHVSQQLGISRQTIANYYQILEDCLVAERLEPLTKTTGRKRLTKSPKYLLFDLGVRRICANEGTRLPLVTLGNLFEQFVGLELIRASYLPANAFKVFYWRDHNGPEIDYVLEQNGQYIPIEVKWTESPTKQDCKHLITFMTEYPIYQYGFIVCQTPRKYLLTENIIAIPWQELSLCYSVKE